ncbi:YqcC family protein [Pseudoalteromonas spongiae]|uniref:YqcC family protein n=1 Tax=Pseudoalteromonas spongiae TaxID=298657 RepID=UPI000C2CE3C9|nr:YqcC family protein [Pseudoalteromonas spongiae]
MIIQLLDELSDTLKVHQLWSNTPPNTAAFASTAPFCYDTMRFEQWLQFVFIIKMKQLVTANQPLPKGANITPMAEQMLRDYPKVIDVIKKIDKALN